MILYTTVSSERATKTQGGNKYINILVNVGGQNDSVLFADIRVNTVNGEYVLWIDSKKHKTLKIKGEKRKGVCYCGDSGLSVPHLQQDH